MKEKEAKLNAGRPNSKVFWYSNKMVVTQFGVFEVRKRRNSRIRELCDRVNGERVDGLKM